MEQEQEQEPLDHAMLIVVSELLIPSRVMLLGRQPNNDKMSIQQPY